MSAHPGYDGVRRRLANEPVAAAALSKQQRGERNQHVDHSNVNVISVHTHNLVPLESWIHRVANWHEDKLSVMFLALREGI